MGIATAQGGLPVNQDTSVGYTLNFTGHNKIKLTADRYGDPTAPTVLFLHGGGQTRHAWAQTATRLAKQGYCAITLDARGHGDSEWSSDGDYSGQALSKDLLAVLSQLPAPPIIVGASMGGLTSMVTIGENSSSRARGLVLVDIAPRVEPEGVKRILDFMGGHTNGFASLEEARDAIAAYNPHRKATSSLKGLQKNLRLGKDGRYRWHWDPRFLEHANQRLEGEAMFDYERCKQSAANLTLPVLLIRGMQSDVVSDEGAEELIELIPHAKYVQLEKAGHMVAGDRNDIFAAAIQSFVEGIEH